MATLPLVLQTEPYYKAFHEKQIRLGVPRSPVLAERFLWTTANFRSAHAHLLLDDDRAESENVTFAYPLVLPRQDGPFRHVVIILHGLNESEYRKYFPWACTLASAGFPVLLFPLTFLINRRPRAWRGEVETHAVLRIRQGLAGNAAATRYNTVLSARLGGHPERLFLGGWQSYFDLLDLVAAIGSGTFTLDGRADDTHVPPQPFMEGTRVDFLGYSIGGYLTLGLLMGQLEHAVLRDSRAVIFAAAAPITHVTPALNANPLSPFILDGRASERLWGFYRSTEADAVLGSPEGQWCRAIFRAEQERLGPVLQRIRSRVLTIGNLADSVIPAEGMAVTLGPLDHVLALGAHEYPFSLADVWEPGVTRRIAKSYNVHPAYAGGFQQFMQAVLELFTK